MLWQDVWFPQTTAAPSWHSFLSADTRRQRPGRVSPRGVAPRRSPALWGPQSVTYFPSPFSRHRASRATGDAPRGAGGLVGAPPGEKRGLSLRKAIFFEGWEQTILLELSHIWKELIIGPGEHIRQKSHSSGSAVALASPPPAMKARGGWYYRS